MALSLLPSYHFLEQFKKLDHTVRERVIRDLRDSNLVENPERGKLLRSMETKVGKSKRFYRVREIKVGPKRNYRLLYTYDRQKEEIYLLSLRPRKNAFKRVLPKHFKIHRDGRIPLIITE